MDIVVLICIGIISLGCGVGAKELYIRWQKLKLPPIYCVNCEYCDDKSGDYMCQHPSYLSLVTGKGKFSCKFMRRDSRFCGRFADFYKEKYDEIVIR